MEKQRRLAASQRLLTPRRKGKDAARGSKPLTSQTKHSVSPGGARGRQVRGKGTHPWKGHRVWRRVPSFLTLGGKNVFMWGPQIHGSSTRHPSVTLILVGAPTRRCVHTCTKCALLCSYSLEYGGLTGTCHGKDFFMPTAHSSKSSLEPIKQR